MGLQTNGLSSHQGAGDSRPPLLPPEGIQSCPDNEFVVYIKDLKSQCDDGLVTFTAEDLMVHAENKYEVRLLDKDKRVGHVGNTQVSFLMCKLEIPQKLQHKFFLLTFVIFTFEPFLKL